MYCKYCGKQLEDGTRFCVYCGKTQETGSQPIIPAPGKKWGKFRPAVIAGIVTLSACLGVIAALSGGGGSPKTTPAPVRNGEPKATEEPLQTKEISENAQPSVKTSDALDDEHAETIEYITCDVSEMLKELSANALRAKQQYDQKYVLIDGYLGAIDSNGSYFSLYPDDDPWTFDTIHCSIRDEEVLNTVSWLNRKDHILVWGRITDVGEVLGYYLDVKKVEQYSFQPDLTTEQSSIIPPEVFQHQTTYEMAGFYRGIHPSDAPVLYANIEDEFYGGYCLSLYRTDSLPERSITSMEEGIVMSGKDDFLWVSGQGDNWEQNDYEIYVTDADNFYLYDYKNNGFYSGAYTRDTLG